MSFLLQLCKKWHMQDLPHAVENTTVVWACEGLLGRTCPFKASCVTCVLITGSDFFISHFLIYRNEDDSQGGALNYNVLHSGNRTNVLKQWQDPARTMLSLSWVFLWLIAGGKIKGFNTSGRGFSLFMLTLWVLWSKFKVTGILGYIGSKHNNIEHFLSTFKMGVGGEIIGVNSFQLIPSIHVEPSYYIWVFSGSSWRGIKGGLTCLTGNLRCYWWCWRPVGGN